MRAIDTSSVPAPRSVDAGPAPMLQWLKIADLVVDDSYQRSLQRGNWKTIRQIAEQFKWSRFSPVFVAPVEGGRYAIIDGQHRTHAAALCGFIEVPCQVVQMNREEQAASFAAVNGLVTKVSLWNVYKAALVAGERWALESAKACEDAGCRLMTSASSTDHKKPGEIYAIALVRAHILAGRAASVTLALSAVRRSVFGEDADAYSNDILKPLLAAVCDRPWLAVDGIDLAAFVDAFDIYASLDRAAEFAKVKRRQGAIGISRYDLVAADIGEALDKQYPQRMAAAS